MFEFTKKAWNRGRVAARLAAALVAAASMTATAERAAAVGLVYVDAINDDDFLTGAFGPNANIAPPSAFSTGFTPDNLWGYRSLLGAESPTFSRYIWEAGGTDAGSNVEDAPEITQTLTGLSANASYDVYVAFWSSNGANWGINAGFASGNYQLFDRIGAAGAIAGTPAGGAVWDTPPTSGGIPIFTEADRTMFLGKVGTASANALGRISVFLNDRPNTTDADRTWFDGLAYIPAGTGITLTATVNRATGNLSIVNNTGEPLQFLSYTVTSTTSAIRPANWLSITDNYVGTDPGDLDVDPWLITEPFEPFPAFVGTLAEFDVGFNGATLATGGATFNLGNVWARSPFENIQVQFALLDGSQLTLTPQFVGAPIAMGDFNADGNLDVADYLALRDRMHTDLTGLGLTRVEAYGLGDLTGDNLVNHADFVAFRTSFIEVNGPAAFAAMLASVPEPTTCALAAFAGLLLTTARRARRRAPCLAVAGGAGIDALKSTISTRERATMSDEQRGWSRNMRRAVRTTCGVAIGAIALGAVARHARAELVTGWGLETGQANATLTEGDAGAFSTTTPTGNAGPRAMLANPFDFADVGDIVQFRGTVTLQNAAGNQQFRFGLFDTFGRTTGTLAGGLWSDADPTGWLGYMMQIGGGGGNDSFKGRTGGAGVWLSNTDTYIVGDGPGGTANPPAATPYNFSLTLRRTGATSVQGDYSFVGGTVNRSGSFTDTTGESVGTTSFNAVGFLLNGSTGSGQFSNLTVEVPKLLRLRVNTTTGYASIAGDPTTTIAMNYFEVASVAGSLAPATSMSIDGAATPSTTSWEPAGGASANIISETNLLGTLALGPEGGPAAIGRAFATGMTQDLVFRYGLPDGTLQTGLVEYVTGGPAGDFDVDGDVDGNDLLAWQRGLGTAFTAAQLTAWRNTYGTTAAAAAGAAVPEPASAALAAFAAAPIALVRREIARLGKRVRRQIREAAEAR